MDIDVIVGSILISLLSLFVLSHIILVFVTRPKKVIQKKIKKIQPVKRITPVVEPPPPIVSIMKDLPDFNDTIDLDGEII
jgi:hypothetical protein